MEKTGEEKENLKEELNNEMNPQTINQLIKKIENCNKTSDIDDVIIQTTKFYTKSVKPNIKSKHKKKNQIKSKKLNISGTIQNARY